MPQPWQRQRLRRLWEMLRRLALLHLVWPRPPWVPRRLMRSNLQPTRLGHWQLHRPQRHQRVQLRWRHWPAPQRCHRRWQKTRYWSPKQTKPLWPRLHRQRMKHPWRQSLKRFLHR
jgi:hypothetical protein